MSVGGWLAASSDSDQGWSGRHRGPLCSSKCSFSKCSFSEIVWLVVSTRVYEWNVCSYFLGKTHDIDHLNPFGWSAQWLSAHLQCGAAVTTVASRTFHLVKRKLCAQETLPTPSPTPPPAPGTTVPLSVPTNLPVLGTLHEWDPRSMTSSRCIHAVVSAFPSLLRPSPTPLCGDSTCHFSVICGWTPG